MFVVSLACAVHIVPEPPANILVIPKHTDPTPISLSPHLMRADDWLQFNPGFQFWSTSHPILSQSELASQSMDRNKENNMIELLFQEPIHKWIINIW